MLGRKSPTAFLPGEGGLGRVHDALLYDGHPAGGEEVAAPAGQRVRLHDQPPRGNTVVIFTFQPPLWKIGFIPHEMQGYGAGLKVRLRLQLT